MTTHGEHPDALYFLLAGTARVSRGGTLVTELPNGHFVGEMSLITGRPATADVATVGDATVMRWPRSELAALRDRDAGLWTRLQSAIGQDLVVKIQRSGSQEPHSRLPTWHVDPGAPRSSR